jgi:hypothetical protein
MEHLSQPRRSFRQSNYKSLRALPNLSVSNHPLVPFSVYDIHYAGILDVSADTGISRQTEGHSFGDHLISESVSVTSSSVIEASTVLCSVS